MRFLLPALLVCIFAGTADGQRRRFRTYDDAPDPPTGITTEIGNSIQPHVVGLLEPPPAPDLQSFLKETASIGQESPKQVKKPAPIIEGTKEEQPIQRYRQRWRLFGRQ